MASTIPSIACLGVIGRHNNPLHTTIFPTLSPTGPPAPIRTPLQFSLLLSSTIDVFESRARQNSSANTGLSGDYGLLHAIDDRLAAYGFETNTGVRFVAIVDMRGRVAGASSSGSGGGGAMGLKDGELKAVFRAMGNAYVRLLQNPFYDPDEQAPARGRPGKKVTSRRFAEDMRRIGEMWAPGVVGL